MTLDDGPRDQPLSRWDPVVAELAALRGLTGDPSYAELARRVTERRFARGLDDHAARVARTTVYDCFRPGRARINLELVRDLAAVLGAPDGEVDRWLRQPTASAERTTSGEDSAAVVVDTTATDPPSVGARDALLLATACVLANLVGRLVVDFLGLPLYLDMIGTAVAAIALGPWRGATVGVVTNLVAIPLSGGISAPFALVNAVGALMWGYGVRRGRADQSLPHYLLLCVVIAAACSATAVPILLVVGGDPLLSHAMVTESFEELVDHFATALSLSNLLTSTTDKLLSGFVALAALATLPAAYSRHLPLARRTA